MSSLAKTALEQLARSTLCNSKKTSGQRKPEGLGSKSVGQENLGSQMQAVQQKTKEQRGLRQCVGDERCGEAVLTVRVRRLHNVWASTNLLKPVGLDTRPAVSTNST